MNPDHTFEAILDRLLSRVPNDVDKREGSIIYDALAPSAAEMAQMYMEIAINENLAYADTASGEYLRRRTAEQGVPYKEATKSRRLGEFYGSSETPVDIPIGSRWAIGDQKYVSISKQALGKFVLDCETAGVAGNQQFGALLPLEYVEGVVRAELTDVLVPGEDEETDEALRARYFTEVNEPSFGGNVADYKMKINGLDGVGGTKVFPGWQGGGTVKCTIIASDYGAPSAALVNEVQTVIDPEQNAGEGLGLAPIGHTVTIMGAQDVAVDVSTTITLQSGYTLGQVESEIVDVISAYLMTLRHAWEAEQHLTVRVSQIDARILGVVGIADVDGTTLNGQPSNLELGNEEIPVLGTVTVSE